jgi:hypothetical protein
MPSATSEGQETLFFSTNKTDRSWRLKEKIVAIIESYFQERDDGIFTFSSARIKDAVDSLEEVDVAYTSFSDPTKYFSFVEVRDRSHNVGREYIQEVKGKRDSLNIEKCKIVSTRGFAPNAVKLASWAGIPLRLLLPEKKETIKLWFKPDSIRIEYPTISLLVSSVRK